MPRLIQFYEDHKADRDRFEILAFHDTRATSLQELDRKLEERDIVDQHWNGKPLPFPILIDSTGKTLERWKVSVFPTLVLIDPSGKVRMVEQGSGGEVEAALKKELSKAPKRRP